MKASETDAIRKVYFVSNRTAITAEALGKSLLAQFPDVRFSTVTFPYVDSIEKAKTIVARINQENSHTQLRPIIISTMIDKETNKILHQSDALVLDPHERFLPDLEQLLKQHSVHQTRQSHRITNRTVYESRIDAIDYSMVHDDGGITRSYGEANTILVGVSRCGKTPTCLYLALQFGLKAANYPITEEDMALEALPKQINAYKNKLFGLTTDAVHLSQIRKARRPDSRYASLEQCQKEINFTERMFKNFNIPYLNTATISIEEIATKIIQIMALVGPTDL